MALLRTEWSKGVVAWLMASVICAFLISTAFQFDLLRTFSAVVGGRLLINLLLIGVKEIYEGSSGGSRVI